MRFAVPDPFAMPAKVAQSQLGRRKFEGFCAWANSQLSIRTGGLSIPIKNFLCEKYNMTTFYPSPKSLLGHFVSSYRP